jgi:hypothetical protein
MEIYYSLDENLGKPIRPVYSFRQALDWDALLTSRALHLIEAFHAQFHGLHPVAAGDNAGYSVSLSTDGNKVAIGSPLNDGKGADAGHVRLYILE